jgi:hypothetical protein
LQEIKHIIDKNNNNKKIDKQQLREKINNRDEIKGGSEGERQNSWRHGVTSSDANTPSNRAQKISSNKFVKFQRSIALIKQVGVSDRSP